PAQTKIDLFARSGSYSYTKAKNDKLTKALVKFIIQDAQPISLAVSPNFCEFIKELNPSITFPYICHTANVIQEKLEEVIENWGLTRKVYSITTDNGANMKVAINKMSNIIRIPCSAHTLQLVVGKGLMPVEQNERLEDAQKTLWILDNNVKVINRNILDYNKIFNHSQTVVVYMFYCSLKYSIDNPEKMFHNAINIVLATLSVSSTSEARKDARRLKEIQLTDNEWDLMRDIVNILGPFFEVTELLGGSEYVTFFYMIPSILGLMDKLDCSTDHLNESNNINFEMPDLVFDNNVGFVDAQKEEEGGPKGKKIKINTPIDVTNMQHKIKNALYNALLHYWDFSDEELFLAYLLDLRFKKLRFATSTQQL
ncbi:20207_t:CDS:2, partial [Cetraspora pellucida]